MVVVTAGVELGNCFAEIPEGGIFDTARAGVGNHAGEFPVVLQSHSGFPDEFFSHRFLVVICVLLEQEVDNGGNKKVHEFLVDLFAAACSHASEALLKRQGKLEEGVLENHGKEDLLWDALAHPPYVVRSCHGNRKYPIPEFVKGLVPFE